MDPTRTYTPDPSPDAPTADPRPRSLANAGLPAGVSLPPMQIPPPPGYENAPPPPGYDQPQTGLLNTGLTGTLAHMFHNAIPDPKPYMGLAMPGMGLLGQMASQGLLSGGMGLAQGQGPLSAAQSAGLSAAGAGIFGKLFGTGAKVASPNALPKFAADKAGEIAGQLKAAVPALNTDAFPATYAGLKKMFFSDGWPRVHEAYDASLKAVVAKGTGTFVNVSEDTAKALGLAVPTVDKSVEAIRALMVKAGMAPPTSAVPAGFVAVDAGKLAEQMTGAWKTAKGAYAEGARVLDAANIGDPLERAAYKTWAGFREFFTKTGALKTNEFNIMKAQAGLSDTPVAGLLRRGLEPNARALLLPGGFNTAVEKSSMAGPLAVGGGTLGAAAGGQVIPGVGHVTGALPGAWLGHKVGQYMPTYSNIPNGPLRNFLQNLMPRAGGVAGGALAAPAGTP